MIWLMPASSVMEHGVRDELLNVGTGLEVSIRELGEIVMEIVGFNGRIVFDTDKPDGAPRKLLDVSRLHALGWRARTTLRDGIAASYSLNNYRMNEQLLHLCRNLPVSTNLSTY